MGAKNCWLVRWRPNGLTKNSSLPALEGVAAVSVKTRLVTLDGMVEFCRIIDMGDIAGNATSDLLFDLPALFSPLLLPPKLSICACGRSSLRYPTVTPLKPSVTRTVRTTSSLIMNSATLQIPHMIYRSGVLPVLEDAALLLITTAG